MTLNNIAFYTFQPGVENTIDAIAAARALLEVMRGEFPERSYSQMMQYRLSGNAANDCTDRYFIAVSGKQYIARLWHGWGKNAGAIGNFGNFATDEKFRRLGIGKVLLNMWFEDINTISDQPLGLFCTSKMELIELYGRYGFRSAMRDPQDPAPLYKPCASAAPTFQEFCEEYYTACDSLQIRPGTIRDRHEIDCLLRFAFRDNNKMPFGFDDMPGYEPAYLAAVSGLGNMPEVITTADGKVVGWAYTPLNGKRRIQLHWQYKPDDVQ